MTKNEALTDLAAVLRESPASLPRVESGPAPLTPAQAYRNSNQTPAQGSSVSSLLTELLPSLTGTSASSGGVSAVSLLGSLITGGTAGATSPGSSGLAGTIGSVIGGGLSPLITGFEGLFDGGSKKTPSPLPLYSAPQSIQLQSAVRGGVISSADSNQSGLPRSTSSSGQPQVTMNIQAMDTQSIMNRSSDIASAVRQAMLQSHPINDVVADL